PLEARPPMVKRGRIMPPQILDVEHREVPRLEDASGDLAEHGCIGAGKDVALDPRVEVLGSVSADEMKQTPAASGLEHAVDHFAQRAVLARSHMLEHAD